MISCSNNDLSHSFSPNFTHQCTNLLSIFVIFGTCLVLNVCAPALAQERLSSATVEELLEQDVHPKRIADLIRQHGIGFELTDELRIRFKRANAGTEVMQALELANIRYRLVQEREKTKGDKRVKEARKPPEPATAATEDSAPEKSASKTPEPARGRETKRPSATAKEDKSTIGGTPEGAEQKVVKLPSQLQEKADHVLRIENVSIKDGEVSGELMNISQQSVFGVQFQVLYSWRWNNDYRPGAQDPGRAEYFTIERELRPGQRVSFDHKPSPPLPSRNDGVFDISVKVIGFSKIFR